LVRYRQREADLLLEWVPPEPKHISDKMKIMIDEFAGGESQVGLKCPKPVAPIY
jgi:hypothetical protein